MSQPIEIIQSSKPKRWVYLLPLFVLLGLMVFFVIGLGLNPRLLPSPLINQPAPEFSLPSLNDPDKLISQADFKGDVSLLNIWATWCTSCRQEHSILMSITESNVAPIYGLLYKDQPENAIVWLEKYGNPYKANAVDMDGRVSIEWGSYGTPETFIIDKEGIIRYKHVGPISQHVWHNTLLPMIQTLQNKNDA